MFDLRQVLDFTIKTYCKLIDALQKKGFAFQTFSGFIEKPSEKVIILRQDVDRLPENSLQFARIQAERGIKGTYYFRVVPGSWNERIIREIYALGHEIGYHYEDVSLAAKWLRAQGSGLRGKKNIEEEIVNIAIESFAKNLEKLRKIAPINTICMHGSPISRLDNRLLWKYYHYHDFGIEGEPYFEINYDEVLYLTDTGRMWDGEAVSVRDKVSGIGHQASGDNPYLDWKVKPFKYREKPTPCPSQEGRVYLKYLAPCTPHPATFSKFYTTSDIIKAAEENKLPDKILMTFHPQRWTDKPFLWMRELVWQNMKNAGKYFLIRLKT